MRFAVVGHVEWVDFAVVDRLPPQGSIVFAAEPAFAEPGGGGAVAAVQLRKLAGAEAAFLTSVGSDELGQRVVLDLRDRHDVDVRAAVHPVAQRRAFTHLDSGHERTITVMGERHVPLGGDALPWDELAGCDGIYFTGGDADALRAARAARYLVATPRALGVLSETGIELDALVISSSDEYEIEAARAVDPPPRHLILTEGEHGGSWTATDGTTGRWAAAEVPGPPVDAYGCGDSFAAALAYGLGAHLGLEGALELAARCGAWCLAGRGPYGNQLTLVP